MKFLKSLFLLASPLSAATLGLAFLLGACASLPPNSNRDISSAITSTADTRLGKIVAGKRQGKPGNAGAVLLGNGLSAFAARMVLADKADRTIDAQYYMIHPDTTGGLFAYQLIKAADRGVRVRLLIDDIDLENRDDGLIVFAQHPNIQLRIFNPFTRNSLRLFQYVSRLGSVTRRMHNKSFTVDNQVTIVGGRNIGNEYFDADPDIMFGDLDLLAIGPVVQQVSASFDKYWNSSLAYPVGILRPDPSTASAESFEVGFEKLEQYLHQEEVQEYVSELRSSRLAELIQKGEIDFYWGDASVFADHPDKLVSYETTEEYAIAPQLNPFFENLEKELIIFSPYFVPGKEGVKALTDMSKHGIKIRILTNSLASTDVGIVHSGYAKYRRALLKAGVELYEINKMSSPNGSKRKNWLKGKSKASLHAKSFVLDRSRVFIGSLNLDPRSIKENTEIGIMFESDKIADDMVEVFNRVVEKSAFRLELQTDDQGLEYILWHGLEDGKVQTWKSDPHTGFWQRFGIGLLGFFPMVESQL